MNDFSFYNPGRAELPIDWKSVFVIVRSRLIGRSARHYSRPEETRARLSRAVQRPWR